MKKFLCLFLAVAMMFAALMMGCSGDEPSYELAGGEPSHELIGRWRHEAHDDMEGTAHVYESVSVRVTEFRADGTGEMTDTSWFYLYPEMERMDFPEDMRQFSWSAEDGYVTMRIYLASHTVPYEIRTDYQGAETLYMELTLFERLSGEPGELYGEWGVTVYTSFEGFEFFEDGTGVYMRRWEGFELDGSFIQPPEEIMDFLWSAEGGYVTVDFHRDEVFPYLIDGDILNLGYWESTRLAD